MKVKNSMIPLISDIEYTIGNSCYNGESYNGWTNEYGCSFRYPVVYETKDGEGIHAYKTKRPISMHKDITSKNIKTLCYKFGANELEIGTAIIDVLNMLEDRYGLDFEALEDEYRKNIKDI